jgi:hypothetical protein
MIPHIPAQRQQKLSASKPFSDLVNYVIENKHKTLHLSSNKFSDILNYSTNSLDKQTNEEKCIAICTHGIADISTASIQMSAVSLQNTRCVDPTFHFILSWPEHERPHPDLIFDAAEHAIKALNLAEHQYVLAVHVDTDNIHCHIAVNRIHPKTFKSRNIEWAKKTLHLAARQSEIKHGWTHDNGIYIVETNPTGDKSIVLNSNLARSANAKKDYAQSHQVQKSTLPAWHDPESLSAWIKTDVSRALKQALPALHDWNALHGWLARYHMTLTDSGGGGMRVHATSSKTGEMLDLPASKGLRVLKRAELEARWGKFTQVAVELNPYISSSPSDKIELGETNDSNIIQCTLPDKSISASHRRGSLHEIESSPRSLSRDETIREARKNQRAAARVDLRSRFVQYERFVREGDTGHSLRIKAIRAERTLALEATHQDTKSAKLALRKNQTMPLAEKLHKAVSIYNDSTQLKLQINANYQTQNAALIATRLPPLGWRTWLHEQAKLGDQAALSALRGIVYQAQLDAKYRSKMAQDAEIIEQEEVTQENRARKFNQLMALLLDEERKEIAIRSAKQTAMRPYEADALLVRYIGMQWRVTGNGNVEYSDRDAAHLFTDRGNRITFDRVLVTDEDICLALVHAQNKYGKQLTLTGQDSIFTERMARLADDMGMTILNPELQMTIENHRNTKALQKKETSAHANVMINEPALQEDMMQASAAMVVQPNSQQIQTLEELLRAKVLSIDPDAKFIIPDIADNKRIYRGSLAASVIKGEATQSGFAQHIGRGIYALHLIETADYPNNPVLEVQYHNGQAVVTVLNNEKMKGRNE